MAAKFKADSFKKITFEDMTKFIEANYPEDKAWFKKIAYENKNGEKVAKYNHLNAKLKFCQKYAPSLIPVAKPKEPLKTSILENW